jgi:hypothetical protein
MSDQESDPIAADEILLRRISSKQYDPERDGKRPSPEVFGPNKDRDQTGLSVGRRKFVTPKAFAAKGCGKSYFVAMLRAGDLLDHGIEVEARPLSDQPEHAELPGLNAGNRKSKQVSEMKLLLAKRLCLGVEGPFPGTSVKTPK